jgi:hypothetical protein
VLKYWLSLIREWSKPMTNPPRSSGGPSAQSAPPEKAFSSPKDREKQPFPNQAQDKAGDDAQATRDRTTKQPEPDNPAGAMTFEEVQAAEKKAAERARLKAGETASEELAAEKSEEKHRTSDAHAHR